MFLVLIERLRKTNLHVGLILRKRSSLIAYLQQIQSAGYMPILISTDYLNFLQPSIMNMHIHNGERGGLVEERRAAGAVFDTCPRPYQWVLEAVEKGHLFWSYVSH